MGRQRQNIGWCGLDFLPLQGITSRAVGRRLDGQSFRLGSLIIW